MEHAKITQVIKADRDKVFDYITDFENIMRKTKMFKNAKLISHEGNNYKYEMETKILGKKYKAILNGIAKPYMLDEEIISDDGSIIKDQMELFEAPEGTRLEWSGEIVQLGKLWKIFGPVMKFFFDMSVKRELKKVAKDIEK